MRVAIYSSVLYGEDFIVDSIKSIIDYVDRVFVVLAERPWGNTNGIYYKGSWVEWPEKFDETESKISSLDKVVVVKGHKYTPWCRHGYGAMLVLGKLKYKPNEILFIDPDCIFSKDEAAGFFSNWDNSNYQWAVPHQIEFWKTTEYQIKRNRPMVSIHRDLNCMPGMVHTRIDRVDNYLFNLGFCVSEKNMKWKHLTSLAFSDVTGESVPNPDWYENKWLSWDFVNNNCNIDVSLGCESAISCAIPYEEKIKVPSDIIDAVNKIRSTDRK